MDLRKERRKRKIFNSTWKVCCSGHEITCKKYYNYWNNPNKRELPNLTKEQKDKILFPSKSYFSMVYKSEPTKKVPNSMHKSIKIEKSNKSIQKMISFYNNTKFYRRGGPDDKKIQCKVEIL